MGHIPTLSETMIYGLAWVVFVGLFLLCVQWKNIRRRFSRRHRERVRRLSRKRKF